MRIHRCVHSPPRSRTVARLGSVATALAITLAIAATSVVPALANGDARPPLADPVTRGASQPAATTTPATPVDASNASATPRAPRLDPRRIAAALEQLSSRPGTRAGRSQEPSREAARGEDASIGPPSTFAAAGGHPFFGGWPGGATSEMAGGGGSSAMRDALDLAERMTERRDRLAAEKAERAERARDRAHELELTQLEHRHRENESARDRELERESRRRDAEERDKARSEAREHELKMFDKRSIQEQMLERQRHCRRMQERQLDHQLQLEQERERARLAPKPSWREQIERQR